MEDLSTWTIVFKGFSVLPVLSFYAKNRSGTYRLEFGRVQYYFDGVFRYVPKGKAKCSNNAAKYFKNVSLLVVRDVAHLVLGTDRVSSVWWSLGGPYCTSKISMSCTIELKILVGIRERFIVLESLQKYSSPTNGATILVLDFRETDFFIRPSKEAIRTRTSISSVNQERMKWADWSRLASTSWYWNHAFSWYEGDRIEQSHNLW